MTEPDSLPPHPSGSDANGDVVIGMAVRVRDALAGHHRRIVLAESCTGGRIAAKLSELPGISQWLCGGFVVYRADSKSRWLGIPHEWLDDPAIGPVSRQVTQELAVAALERTPEADVALAVTGDVGPGAPMATDGMVFAAMMGRRRAVPHERQIRLLAPPPQDVYDVHRRVQRLDEATLRVLSFAAEVLAGEGEEQSIRL